MRTGPKIAWKNTQETGAILPASNAEFERCFLKGELLKKLEICCIPAVNVYEKNPRWQTFGGSHPGPYFIEWHESEDINSISNMASILRVNRTIPPWYG